jgi:hypothetical protein
MNWNIRVLYLLIFLLVNLILHWQYLLLFSRKQRCFQKLIHSGIRINSFNPSIIHLNLTKEISQSNILSIIDNNLLLFQISNPSSITMILSNGYHHLDFIVFNEIENIEFYQRIDISTGTQSLFVTVLDKQYQPVRNLTVHLNLVDYPNINHEYQTNQFGEVIFYYLPKNVQVYIEAICTSTKRHAYAQIDTLNYRNITLILKEMRVFYDEEYDLSDRGYYAV